MQELEKNTPPGGLRSVPPQIQRRTVLKGLVQAAPIWAMMGDGPWAALLPSALADTHESRPLKGLVVADAHFGWKHPQQPKPEQIAEAMARIMKRFPDLDVLLDAGDAHHGNANDRHRGQWTDIVQGGCGTTLFLYAAGNHEIDTWGRRCDIELACNDLGSVPCRPYYSFDLKGVHLVCLPELMFMCYVTDEALDWLELDLTVNRDKTTLIFTHNSVSGTTLPHDDPGYRRLANSDVILRFLDRHPNVMAWLHGHNHTYEMVEKAGRLFVSCGRIGGFIPPGAEQWAGEHLGGIYFEVAADHLSVQAYSATQEEFLHALGYPHLSRTLRTKTSLDPKAPAAISYGSGKAQPGQRFPVANHYVGGSSCEVFISGSSSGSILNENSDLTVYAERTHPLAPDKQILPGYGFEPHDDRWWSWASPGVRIAARTEGATTLVVPGVSRGMRSYYCCVPGKPYRAILELESNGGGQEVRLKCLIHDRSIKQMTVLDGPDWKLVAGTQTKQMDFTIPPLAEVESVYNSPQSDNLFHLLIEARFSVLSSDVVLKRFALLSAVPDGPIGSPAVLIDGQPCRQEGEFAPGEIVRLRGQPDRAGRVLYEVAATGNQSLAWLAAYRGLTWQVRNAHVADRGDHFEVGPLRNRYSPRQEVVIAPLAEVRTPYVHRLRAINAARIYPCSQLRRELIIDVVELLGPGEVEIRSSSAPAQVHGSQKWSYQGGRLIVAVDKPGTIRVV